MNARLKKLTHSTEFYIALIILLFSLIVQVRSGLFYSPNNLIDIVRSFSIPAMFCIGEMMVLISGGTDVSFPAIASMSMYISCTRLADSPPVVIFLVAMLIGLVIGTINGLIIAHYKFNPLIVTLGTSTMCFGIMQGVFGSREFPLSEAMYNLGKMKLFTATDSATGLTSDMPIGIILTVILLVIGWFILNKTMLGLGIYAIGGDERSAERAGFRVFGIKMFIYMFSGACAGLIGVLRATMLLAVHPNNLEGMEMTVIAACILGGVSITGGKGTVLGACLGMLLLTIITNSLILIGVPTEYQKLVTGIIIILGTTVSALQLTLGKKKLSVDVMQ